MQHKLLFLLIILTANIMSLYANEISTATNFIAQPFDVLEYQVAARIDSPSSKNIQGVCTMNVKLMHQSLEDKFFFHLFYLKIDSCKIAEELIIPTQEVDAHGVPYYSIPIGQYADNFINISVYYSGTMRSEDNETNWGGIHYQDSVLFNMGVGFKNTHVSAASYWFPCYDHPSDKALYKLSITVPDEYQVAMSGYNAEADEVNNGKRTVNSVGIVPAATYMIGIAIGKLEKLSIEGTNIPNIIYAPANKVQDCIQGMKLLPKMLECFEQTWGEYPFEKVGYVITAIGSMEHQTMIALSKDAVNKSDTICSTAAHELAHSWFGGSLTPLDFRSAWLNEAFANYSEAIWYDYLKGDNQYYRKIKDMSITYFYNSSVEGVFPIHDFPRDSNSSNYPSTIYNKGAVVVHQLRRELGDSLFFGAIRNYIRTYRNSGVTTEIFKKSIEDYTKKDLTNFFNMWIYNYGYPIVNVYLDIHQYPDSSGMTKINVKTEQVQDTSWGIYNNFTYEINFKLPNNDVYSRYVVINESEQTVTLDSIPRFTSIGDNYGKISASLAKPITIAKANIPNIDYINSKYLSIYPNPVMGHSLNLFFKTEIRNSIGISIIDLNGNIVRYALINNFNDKIGNFPLDLSGIPSGTYILNAKNANFDDNIKFQIMD